MAIVKSPFPCYVTFELFFGSSQLGRMGEGWGWVSGLRPVFQGGREGGFSILDPNYDTKMQLFEQFVYNVK